MHNDFDFKRPSAIKPGCEDFGHKPTFPAPKPPCHDGIHKPHECNIAPYNKITFNNKSEATQLLSNKDLHTGEIAFAYYYDNKSAYGINAIAAVGNIKVGSPNILFENSEDVQRWVDELVAYDGMLERKLKEIKTDIQNIFSKLSYVDKFEELDQSLNSVIEKQESMNSSMNEINVSIENINTSLNTLNDLIDNVPSDYLKHIDILNTSINNWVEKHKADIVIEHNLIRDELKQAISDISINLGDTTNIIGNELEIIKNEFDT